MMLVAAVMLLVQWSFRSGMVDYLNDRHRERGERIAALLAEQYRQFGSWAPFAQEPSLLPDSIVDALEESGLPGPRHGKHRQEIESPRQMLLRLQLLDAQQQVVSGRRPGPEHALVPIRVNGSTVGWLMVPQQREVLNGFENKFLQQQRLKLLAIGGTAIAVAALIALFLARHLVGPIRTLKRGAHALTQGHYSIDNELQLSIQRSDEFGELARDFNELARTLAANDSGRKRWLADISHELRTPLAILRGEIEAMLDGVRPINRDNLQSVQQEVTHLTRLIDDLHSLTTADIGGLQYRKTRCDVAEVWREVCEAHSQPFAAAGLALRCDIPPGDMMLYGDEGRLRQLLDNLLDNSRKYTAVGGLVQVTLRRQTDNVCLTVEDSAPGVPTESLPKLFDHLYRVENSRNRGSGGSGLGLAICQRIVIAHGGAITAAASALGGLRIEVLLPDNG
ncbi:MAG: ATP-binding protein [Steroidobacteraceae bacterium]